MLQTLDDLIDELPYIKLVSVHNGGRGGGEKVAQKILLCCATKGQHVEEFSSIKLSESIKYLFFNRKIFRNNKKSTILFTAGPRDLFLMWLCMALRIGFACYIQVPYHNSTTLKDPIHYIVVTLYRITVMTASKYKSANSTSSALFFKNQCNIFLPITSAELIRSEIISNCNNNNDLNGFVMVARLNTERGRGSRNIKMLEKLLLEIQLYNEEGNKQVTFDHIGEISDKIKDRMLRLCDTVTIHGYVEDCHKKYNYDDKIFVYLSNYEGFGLAAFEASVSGNIVAVNNTFPGELFAVCPNIKLIDKVDQKTITHLLRNDTSN